MRKLKLTESFLEPYKTAPVNWGYNGLGGVVYKRTYAAKKDDGTLEDWWETCRRVVEGTYSHQIVHCEKNGLPFDMLKAQHSAQKMYALMFDMKWLPPGRGLQHMGRDVVDAKGAGVLYNCSFLSTESIGKKGQVAEPFCTMMDLSMLGIGVGFDTKGENTASIVQPKQSDSVFVVEDTREGWVEAVRATINPFFGVGSMPSAYNYSLIRAEGALLNTMGGISSGYKPLELAVNTIKEYLGARVGTKLNAVGIVDLMNIVARCVVSGGVRRSALLALGDPSDDGFMSMKDPSLHGDLLNEWRWASNNSISDEKPIDYKRIGELIAKNGEPGVAWLDNAKHYGRIKDGHGNYDLEVQGCNPCQPEFATVLTRGGIRRFGDVTVGDEIWSEDGWVTIAKKWSTGVKPVYRYSTTMGEFIGTENHRVVSLGKKVEVSDAETLTCLVGPNSRVQSLNIQDVMDGLVIGDGSAPQPSHTGRLLHIGINDGDILSSEVAPLVHGKYGGDSASAYRVTSTIADDELPVTYHRTIPDRFRFADPITVCGFLRGLFSANGSVVGREGQGRITLKASSLDVIKAAQEMLSSVGIASYYTTNKPKEVQFKNGPYVCKQSYDLNITRDRGIFATKIGFIQSYKCEKLMKSVSASSCVPRKVDYEITSREYLGDHEVFDITVDGPSHTYWTGGVNVSNCAEIFMVDAELCNLNEVPLNRLDSLDELRLSLKYAYLYSKTVTLVPTHNKRINAVIGRNRRIGTSITGITQAIAKFGYSNLMAALDDGYKYLRELDILYSRWLCIPTSIKITTCKPSGSVSILSSSSPGVHFPHAEYYIRRFKVDRTSPILNALIDAGYEYEESIAKDNSLVFKFPVWEKDFTKGKADASMREQLELAAQLQYYWADNSVSVTVTFNKDEEKDIPLALEQYSSRLKSVSMLPLDGGTYKQAPYETCTKDEYERLASKLKPIDFSSINLHEVDDKFCEGDKCLIG